MTHQPNPTLWNVEQIGAREVVISHGNIVILQYKNNPIVGYRRDTREPFMQERLTQGQRTVANRFLRERDMDPKGALMLPPNVMRQQAETGREGVTEVDDVIARNPRQITVYGDHPKQTEAVFGVNDQGTFIDGAFGEGHAAQKMISLLETVKREAFMSANMADRIGGLIDELGDDNPEDLNEAFNDATDVLEEYTDEKVYWLWDAGDLILTDEFDDDNEAFVER